MKPIILTMNILKKDSMFFHVQIADCPTVTGMTKAEIEGFRKQYGKKKLLLNFANKKLEDFYQGFTDNPELD